MFCGVDLRVLRDLPPDFKTFKLLPHCLVKKGQPIAEQIGHNCGRLVGLSIENLIVGRVKINRFYELAVVRLQPSCNILIDGLILRLRERPPFTVEIFPP